MVVILKKGQPQKLEGISRQELVTIALSTIDHSKTPKTALEVYLPPCANATQLRSTLNTKITTEASLILRPKESYNRSRQEC